MTTWHISRQSSKSDLLQFSSASVFGIECQTNELSWCWVAEITMLFNDEKYRSYKKEEFYEKMGNYNTMTQQHGNDH